MTLIQGTPTRPASPAAHVASTPAQAGAFDSVLRDVAAEAEMRRDTRTGSATGSATGPSVGAQEQSPGRQGPLSSGEAIVGFVPVSADVAGAPPVGVPAPSPALTHPGITDPELAGSVNPDAVNPAAVNLDPVNPGPEITQLPPEPGSESAPVAALPTSVLTPLMITPAPPTSPVLGEAAQGIPDGSSLVPLSSAVAASEPGRLPASAPPTAPVGQDPVSSGTQVSGGEQTPATRVTSSVANDQADGSPAHALPVPAERAPATNFPVVEPVVDATRAVVAPGAAPAITASAASTPPVALPPNPPTAPAQPLSTQLAQPLFSLVGARPGEHLMTIQVTPDNLGPVTVRAMISGDDIRIEMFAPSDSGREALRQILTDLRRDLAGGGLSASLDLSSKERFDESTEHRPAETPSRRSAPAQATAAEHQQRPAASGSLESTLDITI